MISLDRGRSVFIPLTERMQSCQLVAGGKAQGTDLEVKYSLNCHYRIPPGTCKSTHYTPRYDKSLSMHLANVWLSSSQDYPVQIVEP